MIDSSYTAVSLVEVEISSVIESGNLDWNLCGRSTRGFKAEKWQRHGTGQRLFHAFRMRVCRSILKIAGPYDNSYIWEMVSQDGLPEQCLGKYDDNDRKSGNRYIQGTFLGTTSSSKIGLIQAIICLSRVFFSFFPNGRRGFHLASPCPWSFSLSVATSKQDRHHNS